MRDTKDARIVRAWWRFAGWVTRPWLASDFVIACCVAAKLERVSAWLEWGAFLAIVILGDALRRVVVRRESLHEAMREEQEDEVVVEDLYVATVDGEEIGRCWIAWIPTGAVTVRQPTVSGPPGVQWTRNGEPWEPAS